MWDAIKEFFHGRDPEGFVSSLLLVIALVYYIPKGLYWWFTTKESDIKEQNDNIKPRKPQDYL
jgi:hypothetical protein